MKAELVSREKKTNRMTIVVKGTTSVYMNALRRTIIDEVPSMAVKEVEFRKNDSALYDEMLALRIGLVPLTTDLSAYNLPEECSCKGEGCLKCTLKMTLAKKGPCMVYASDLKIKDPKVKPAFPDTPLVKLLKDQELEFEATATLGIGRDHAKYSPAHAWYRNVPELDVEKVKDGGKVISVCPANVFEMKGSKINVKNAQACVLCGACVDADGNVKLNQKTDEYLLYVESFGQLKAEDILSNAVEVLGKQLTAFEKAL